MDFSRNGEIMEYHAAKTEEKQKLMAIPARDSNHLIGIDGLELHI